MKIYHVVMQAETCGMLPNPKGGGYAFEEYEEAVSAARKAAAAYRVAYVVLSMVRAFAPKEPDVTELSLEDHE